VNKADQKKIQQEIYHNGKLIVLHRQI